MYYISIPAIEELHKVYDFNSHTSLLEPYTVVLLMFAGKIIDI